MLLTAFLLVATLFIAFNNLPIEGELLDLKSSYTYEEAVDELETYGSAGRTTYLWVSVVLDTFLPVVYATFFAGLIYRFRVVEGVWWLAFIPVFAGIWDLAENAQISIMLVSYPEISGSQVAWASTFTYAKHLIGSVYVALAAGLVLIALVRTTIGKLRRQTGSP